MSQAKLVIANHLSTALDLLGYENNQPKEWRYGLVSQIALFAGVTRNEDLES